MKRNNKLNWLVVLSVVAIFSFFSTGSVQAWGPLAQSAIAQAVQDADGVPPATASRNFVIETTMPKAFEFTDQSYAKMSYDFTDIMSDHMQGYTDYCQVLAWGASQTAEKTGDHLFFQPTCRDTYERWVKELLCDALLFCVESPYYGTAVAEVAVMPKLMGDSSGEYVAVFGGDAISGSDAILAAHFQAHVLVGEMALVESPVFQDNAKRLINTGNWTIAMDRSVENAVEYVINSTQAASSSNWMVGDASDFGSQLLGKLGSLLVATGNASIANQSHLGVYSYRVGLNTDQVNEITVGFLYAVARNLGEHPVMRNMARSLYNLMTEDVLDFSHAGPLPASFGEQSWAE
jgi:hypothetical protein